MNLKLFSAGAFALRIGFNPLCRCATRVGHGALAGGTQAGCAAFSGVNRFLDLNFGRLRGQSFVGYDA